VLDTGDGAHPQAELAATPVARDLSGLVTPTDPDHLPEEVLQANGKVAHSDSRCNTKQALQLLLQAHHSDIVANQFSLPQIQLTALWMTSQLRAKQLRRKKKHQLSADGPPRPLQRHQSGAA